MDMTAEETNARAERCASRDALCASYSARSGYRRWSYPVVLRFSPRSALTWSLWSPLGGAGLAREVVLLVALAGCSAAVPLTESTSTEGTIDSGSVDAATVTSSDPVSADSTGLGGPIAPGDLLFIHAGSAGSLLSMVRLDDGTPYPVEGFGDSFVNHAVFSPDGDLFAASINGGGGSPSCRIDVMTSDQTQRWSLVEGFTPFNFVWSPDSATIAGLALSEAGAIELMLIDTDDGSRAIAMEFPEGSAPSGARWSPDGSEIMFSLNDGSQSDIVIFDLASSETRLIDATPADETRPEFAPDGTRLAFGSDRNGGCAIFIHELSAGISSQVTASWEGDDCSPELSWASQGDRIAYAHEETNELRVLMVDLGDEVTILGAESFGVHQIRWSPSGDFIAYERSSDPSGVLGIITADGKSVLGLGEGYGIEWRPGATGP